MARPLSMAVLTNTPTESRSRTWKGSTGEDGLVEIILQEAADVVARKTEGLLCQVVVAETEELDRLGNFVGGQAGTRDFDHGAVEILY